MTVFIQQRITRYLAVCVISLGLVLLSVVTLLAQGGGGSASGIGGRGGTGSTLGGWGTGLSGRSSVLGTGTVGGLGTGMSGGATGGNGTGARAIGTVSAGAGAGEGMAGVGTAGAGGAGGGGAAGDAAGGGTGGGGAAGGNVARGTRTAARQWEGQDSQRPALGISVGRDSQGRILVNDVRPDSPAAQAGIQVGDEILSIGNTPVRSTDQVVDLVQGARIGQPFMIHVRRDGQMQTATGQLGSFVSCFGQTDMGRGGQRPVLGVRVRDNPNGQIEVTAVEPNSPAQTAGLRPGDIILNAGGKQVRNFNDLTAALDQTQIGSPIDLRVQRQGQELMVAPMVTSYAAMLAPVAPGGTERQAMRRSLDQQMPEQNPMPPASGGNSGGAPANTR